MSTGSSYRLETPRPRQPPSPLQFQASSFHSSVLSNQDSDTLLYDLPSAPSTSPPPTSPRTKNRLTSPTSPTFSGRSGRPRNGRPTPPPSGRNRSITPLGVLPSELEKFAEYCRAWYYNQDELSGRLMTQTLANVTPSQRAPFSRLQASIRSAYHRSVNARKTAEFQAHLSATQPGGSLMPHSRAAPSGSVAQKERYDRFDRFVRNWCTMGMPGTKPFFEALWAIMRLEIVPEQIGGAGGNRIEWELDDAVFKEAAGKDFMLEAIDVLKGVLAFEEVQSSENTSTSNILGNYPNTTISHSRSQSQPLPSDKQKSSAIPTHTQPKRARAPSDPFLDTPVLSPSFPSSSSHSSGNTSAFLNTSNSDGGDEPVSSGYPDVNDFTPPRNDFLFDENEEHLRIWTSPDLPNFEYLNLLKAFPSFITRRPLPRFPIHTNPARGDIEEGDDGGGEGKEIHFGTGTMRISSKQRMDGWQGSWWSRFVLWWRRVFC